VLGRGGEGGRGSAPGEGRHPLGSGPPTPDAVPVAPTRGETPQPGVADAALHPDAFDDPAGPGGGFGGPDSIQGKLGALTLHRCQGGGDGAVEVIDVHVAVTAPVSSSVRPVREDRTNSSVAAKDIRCATNRRTRAVGLAVFQ
jgi:hypothetical protein